MSDLYKTYNKTLKELIDIVSNDLPEDTIAGSLKRKYTAIVTTDRTILLTESGKELFEYRDYIAGDKWDELINKEWNESITDSKDFDKKSIQNLIGLLKQIWNNYDEDEKNHIKKLVKILLTTYVKYRMNM